MTSVPVFDRAKVQIAPAAPVVLVVGPPGKLITFEIGLRFLTDFLAGDTYFKVQRPGHNLDRCRTQFRLIESITQQEAAMHRLVDRI